MRSWTISKIIITWIYQKMQTVHLEWWVDEKVLKAGLVTIVRFIFVNFHLIILVDGVRLKKAQAERSGFRCRTVQLYLTERGRRNYYFWEIRKEFKTKYFPFSKSFCFLHGIGLSSFPCELFRLAQSHSTVLKVNS